jgi:hypothetical protein
MRHFARLPTLVFTLCFALGAVSCTEQKLAPSTQLEALTKSCSSQMVANTCQAMKNSGVTFPKEGDVVFVAGVGPVDARLLARLSAAGDAMCADVKITCEADWDGKACTVLRKMYAM